MGQSYEVTVVVVCGFWLGLVANTTSWAIINATGFWEQKLRGSIYHAGRASDDGIAEISIKRVSKQGCDVRRSAAYPLPDTIKRYVCTKPGRFRKRRRRLCEISTRTSSFAAAYRIKANIIPINM